HQLPHQVQIHRLSSEEVAARIDRTVGFWRDWSARCTYQGPYREQVLRSALVLKGLTNAPTGAIVAAPTTSLPEAVGGVRNWDYRYSWLRDAAMNLYALFTLGYTEEAHAFMGWLERTTAGRAEELQLMYGVGGERLLPEVELDALEGYRGSRPVRVGNAAADQFQLDVYGYLLDTAWLYHRHGGRITPTFWRLLSGAVDVIAHRWTEPDDGIWEVRGGPRHFVSSKVMAWVAVDRAIRLARIHGLPADLDRWTALRRTIRRRLESAGTDPATGAFTQAFANQALDAANLLLPLVRFLPPDDPRIRATVERTARELAPHGLVHRYLGAEDGLAGGEASFVICSFWLVDNLALAGQTEEARALFERLLGYANDVGLLAEEIDPPSGELLGNFPQAFSHVGLISAAINLERGRRTPQT
ncbi:MAG TPA: glycoside hydrolase family 15 protein, partial [Propionibacteriaceae bacterium]|nr:glycoside hydrolase family 15 protein [Propionibacteriaceae bacterium]